MALMNKITSTLNKGVATVGANSKAMMEKSKINAAISNLEKERLALITNLGQATYNLYKDTDGVELTDALKNIMAEIEKRLELIDEKNKELAEVEKELALITSGTAIQPTVPADAFMCSCGHPNAKDAKFCGKCGSNLSEQKAAMEEVATVDAGTTCACGQSNPAEAKFCSGCGSGLSDGRE